MFIITFKKDGKTCEVLKMAECEDSEWEPSDSENGVDLNPTQHDSLLIQDLPQGTSEEQLELHFENPRYGGGDILQISINRENNSAVVKFKESRGM